MFRKMPSLEFVNTWMWVSEMKLRAESEMNLKQQKQIANTQRKLMKGYLDWSEANVQ